MKQKDVSAFKYIYLNLFIENSKLEVLFEVKKIL